MTPERRFQAGFEEEATDAPGLVLGQDGTVSVVATDGTRSELSGGSLPDQWTQDQTGEVTANADTDVTVLKIEAQPDADSGGDPLLEVSGPFGTVSVRPLGSDLDLAGGPDDGTAVNLTTVAGAALLGYSRFISGADGSQELSLHAQADGQAASFQMRSTNADRWDLDAGTGEGVLLAAHGAAGPALEIRDANGAPVFRIDADGTVHIKAATAVQSDL